MSGWTKLAPRRTSGSRLHTHLEGGGEVASSDRTRACKGATSSRGRTKRRDASFDFYAWLRPAKRRISGDGAASPACPFQPLSFFVTNTTQMGPNKPTTQNPKPIAIWA